MQIGCRCVLVSISVFWPAAGLCRCVTDVFWKLTDVCRRVTEAFRSVTDVFRTVAEVFRWITEVFWTVTDRRGDKIACKRGDSGVRWSHRLIDRIAISRLRRNFYDD